MKVKTAIVGKMHSIRKHTTYSLSLYILIIVQLVLTFLTLGYVIFLKYTKESEYPVVIVKPPSSNEYTRKHNGKITIFDLPDLAYWQYFSENESSSSSQIKLSFTYPPGFTVEDTGGDTIYIRKGSEDYIVVQKSVYPSIGANEEGKQIFLGTSKRFFINKNNEKKDLTPVQYNKRFYWGEIDGIPITVFDREKFSPEVVYLLLMSMDLQK